MKPEDLCNEARRVMHGIADLGYSVSVRQASAPAPATWFEVVAIHTQRGERYGVIREDVCDAARELAELLRADPER